jgi:hypothetical protein
LVVGASGCIEAGSNGATVATIVLVTFSTTTFALSFARATRLGFAGMAFLAAFGAGFFFAAAFFGAAFFLAAAFLGAGRAIDLRAAFFFTDFFVAFFAGFFADFFADFFAAFFFAFLAIRLILRPGHGIAIRR